MFFVKRMNFFRQSYSETNSTSNPSSANINFLYIVLLVLVSLLLYSASLKNGFVWDAQTVILNDPGIRDFRNAFSYFKEDYWRHIPQEGNMVNRKYYRPVTKLLRLIEYNIFGAKPLGYNAANVLTNALVVVFAFLLVLNITKSARIAFVSSLLYAVSPNRAEAVSWAYMASNLLAALFSLVSFLFYIKRKYIISLSMFLLSLFSHESSVLLPLVLVTYKYFIEGEKSLKKYIPLLPFFIVLACYLVMRNMAVGAPPITNAGIFTLINTISVITKRHLRIFFIPDTSVAIYTGEPFSTLNTEIITSYLLIIALVCFAIVLWTKRKPYLFWYLWFFIWTAIVFNVGTFGEYLMPQGTLYLASLGFCVLIASFISEVYGRYRSIAILSVACLTVLYSSVAFSKSLYWENNEKYITKVLESVPRSSLAHYALATEYVSKGNFGKALAEYKKTVAVNPSFSYAYNNMGNVYFMTGDIEAASAAWQKAINSDPSNPNPYYNLGMIAEKNGNDEEALQYYKKWVSFSPQPSPDILNQINEVESRIKKK